VSWQIVYTKQAQKDAKKLASSNLKKKAQALLKILNVNPYQNPPPYEKLVGDLAGAYSRRINIQHRVVYQVLEERKITASAESPMASPRSWGKYSTVMERSSLVPLATDFWNPSRFIWHMGHTVTMASAPRASINIFCTSWPATSRFVFIPEAPQCRRVPGEHRGTARLDKRCHGGGFLRVIKPYYGRRH
jgi:Txe/YoeB family toxin of toxin-antitoxin system